MAANPPHATQERVFADVVPPKTHLVEKLWAPLSRSFRAAHVLLKRREITKLERKSAKISNKRPRFFISVHILPLCKRQPSAAAAAAGGGSGGGGGRASSSGGGGGKAAGKKRGREGDEGTPSKKKRS